MPNEVDAVNVWDWMRIDATEPAPDSSDIIDALATALVAIYGEIQPNLSDLVTVVAATNYQMGYESGRWVVQELLGVEAIGVQGGDTNQMLPHGVAGLLTFPTTTSKTRGRKFIPGLSEVACEDGVWLSACLTNLLDMADLYMDDVIYDSVYVMRPVLLSTKGNVLNYNAYSASGTPAYQRRRKPGVGS
jgi:hypothetical protein